MRMWALTNRTPYALGKAWGRNKDGVHEWIVVAKGTYNITPNGTAVLADKQAEPRLLPEYNGDDGVSSIRYEADLVSLKPTTDALINGTAYAPKGLPSKEFLISVRIGRIHKELRVVGNRRWKQGILRLHPSAVEPVTEVPIVYERAFGGFDQSDPDPQKHQMDTRNPVGCGLVPQEGKLLPNFEYTHASLQNARPAGFGAIPSHWSPRRELQGTYDESWQKSRYPLLPADWNPRSLLCSPVDQQPDSHLRGGELVELTNLTRGGELRFSLPKAYLTFTTRIDNRVEEHRGQLGTVIIEPDFLRVTMVWQTSLTVRANVDYLEETVVKEKPYL